MKLCSPVKIGLLGLIAWALPQMALAATVAAKKDGVTVTSEAKRDSAVIQELKKGDTVDAGDREGMFWKVKTKDGKAGYVSVMAVQRQGGEDTGLASAIRDEALKARQNNEGSETTRARSAVMGVRGLDESKDTAMAGNIRPDLRAVYRMEDRAVASARVDRLEQLVGKEIENTNGGVGETNER